MRISTGTVALLAALLSEGVHTEPIERIRPSDGIASIRINASVLQTHIDVTFTEDMIPLGGGHGSFAVKLEGRGQCSWGWRGPRTVSCLLGRDDYLPLAEKYALVITDGLTAVSGNSIPPFRLEFETDPPTARYASMDWDGPVSPVIYLHTNVPVSPRELQRRVVLEPTGGTGPAVHVRARLDPEPVEYLSPELQYAITSASALLADTAYVIRVHDGLEGIDSGIAGVAHDAGSFRTHASFGFMGIGCGPHADGAHWERQNPLLIPAKPDCAPEQPVSLLFSAEPEIRGLYDTLTGAGLPPEIARTSGVQAYSYRYKSIEHYNSAKVIYGIRLAGFPAGTVNTVSLPASVKDRFGRELEPTTATFPTRNFVPAFLDPVTLRVVASGTGKAVKYPVVNSDAVVARFYRDQPPGVISVDLDTRSSGVNERGEALLDVEQILGKPSGVLIGEVAVDQRAMRNKHAWSYLPLQYLPSAGAILSTWDVILAAQGLGLRQRHSIWVSSLETGEGVSDAKVELLERPHGGQIDNLHLALAYTGGKVLGTARTDTDGFAEIFPSPAMPEDIYPSMVRVSKGDVVVVLPLEEYQFRHSGNKRPSRRADDYFNYVGYLGEGGIITGGVTDKPLYRSGETVRIKGYVRARDDNRLVIPTGTKPWKLSCTAYPNDLCAGKSIELDEYGAFDATITLPAAAIDGEYRVSVESESGGRAAMGFRVANYKPLPHRVILELANERVVGKDPIPVTATAQYFAGGPVRNAAAQVFIDVRADSSPAPEPLFEDYYFGRTHGYRGEGARSVSNARFDQNGRLTGSFALPVDSPARGVMTVTVGAQHDGGEWAYSQPVSSPYARAPFLLGLEQKSDAIAPGEAYDAGVVLVDLHDTRAEDLYVIQTLEYSTDRYDGKTDAPMYEVDRCTVVVTPGNRGSCELTPDRLGQAVIRARLMRDKEEIFQLERDVTVALPTLPWYRESDTLDMEVQGGDLRANQAAEISVDIPYDAASVLFSIHRNFVLEQWMEVLRKGKRTVSIPLTEKHAPGFTITAIARPTGSLAGTSIGSAFVSVQSAERLPTLIVESDKEDYKAGEQVNLTIRSTARGKTQLAVAVIDEAVLDLVPDADDIFDPPGREWAGLLEVWGNFQWWQLSRAMWTGDEPGGGPETLSIANLSVSISGAPTSERIRAPGAHETAETLLRRDFAEAAYFNPNVITSDAGIAAINFIVPDNIGRWRVVVIGADTDGRLFANTGGFNVALPLEVRADLPSRLVAGDSLQPRATVLNRKPDASEITLSLNLDADNGEIASELKTAIVNSMESMALSAAAGPVSGDGLKLIAKASDGEDSDGVVITTAIVQPVELRSWTSTAPLSRDAGLVQVIELPANARTDTAKLRVTLDKSVIGDLSQTFRYMSQSGHPSWEQILSRAVVAAYAGSWNEGSAYRVTNFDMQNQLLQGANFQGTRGGMNHFEPRDDRANDYLSAYTLLALGWIEEQGFDIPEYRHGLLRYVDRRVNRALLGQVSSYYTEDVPSPSDMPIMLAALSSALSGAVPLPEQYLQYLRSRVAEFDLAGLAYAQIAATNFDAPSELRKELTDRLQAQLVETFDRIEISGGDYRFGSRSELYCAVLAALQDAGDHAPGHLALAKLVSGGYEFRDRDNGFGNTHANAVCVSALTKFRDMFETPKDGISVQVTTPGLEPSSLKLEESESATSSEIMHLPLEKRRTQVAVNLTTGTSGYASANVRYEIDLSKETERSHGYTLQRLYSIYRDDDWRTLDDESRIAAGDWVRIELKVVNPVTRRFVAITDPTPAGLEPVDPSLSTGVPSGMTQRVQWWNTSFDRQALSNVQSRFYAEWLTPGMHTVTYYARAKFAGEFLALPAKVESMYSEGVFATTGSATIRVENDRISATDRPRR